MPTASPKKTRLRVLPATLSRRESLGKQPRTESMEPQGSKSQRWAKTSAATVLLAGALLLLLRVLFVPYEIRGDSMLPTLRGNGAADVVLVNRFAYWTTRPTRGDVVVLDGKGLPTSDRGLHNKVKRPLAGLVACLLLYWA